MKLSEILGWPDKQKEYFGVNTVQAGEAFGHNTALTSCDREIDREALADKIMEINFESYGFSHEEVAYKTADKIISTMPTWLKRIEGK